MHNSAHATAIFELNGLCNLSCQHCYLPHTTKGETKLTEKMFKSALQELVDEGFIGIIFSGYEPLLHKSFFKFAEIAREHNFLIKLKSNGTLIDEQIAQKIKKCNIAAVDISLYSHFAEKHDNITRSKGSFKQSINAIKLLKKQNVKVKINVSVLYPNDNLEEFLSFANDLSVPIVFDPIIISSFDTRDRVEEFKLSKEALRQYITFLVEKKLISTKHFYKPYKKGALCGICEKTIRVDAAANVFPCGLYPEPIGSLYEYSLSTILQKAKSLRSTIEKSRPCPNCELLPFCQPCPALSKLEDNNLFGCSSSKKMYAEVLRDLYNELN